MWFFGVGWEKGREEKASLRRISFIFVTSIASRVLFPYCVCNKMLVKLNYSEGTKN